MVLVDTSVWVAHFRKKDPILKALLDEGGVVMHPFVVGEIACGNPVPRGEILGLLASLPSAVLATDREVLSFIEGNRLAGSGVGYLDVHLLASAKLTKAPLWTVDSALRRAASRLGVAYQ